MPRHFCCVPVKRGKSNHVKPCYSDMRDVTTIFWVDHVHDTVVSVEAYSGQWKPQSVCFF